MLGTFYGIGCSFRLQILPRIASGSSAVRSARDRCLRQTRNPAPKKIEIGVGPDWIKDGGRGWVVWCAAGFLLLAKLAFQNRLKTDPTITSPFHLSFYRIGEKRITSGWGPTVSFLVQEYAFFG